MLPVFPAPYEDELLYSLCARYARLMNHGNPKTTLRHLVDRGTITAVTDLPTHLGALSERLAQLGGPTADALIDRHTLLPYFGAFHPAEQVQAVRDAMCGDGQPHWLLGLMASRVPIPRALRYCPSCVAQERERQGESYWHRLHQLPGVLVCAHHSVWLEDSAVRLPERITRHAFVPAQLIVPHEIQARPLAAGAVREVLIDLAHRSQALLSSSPGRVSPSDMRASYLSALAGRGLATYSGRLKLDELRSAWQAFFPAPLHTLLDVPETVFSGALRLLRKPRAAGHTLHHLLLQSFLGLDQAALGAPVQPFGTGPWPCLNRASLHHGEPRITSVQVDYTRNAREPIGTFTCACGFAYRRVGPDQVPKDAWRLDRMAAYGPVWARALKRGWLDPELSLRALSRRLGFDPNTVRRQAAALRLPHERPGHRGAQPKAPTARASTTPPMSHMRQSNRDAWSRERRQQPDATLRTLRAAQPGVYSWLYRHDRDWLTRQKPVAHRLEHRLPRVDWNQRDTEFARSLRRAARDLRRRPSPVRVTTSRLKREIGQAAVLSQHLDRLPKCARTLEALSETREAFAIRRIQQASQKLQDSGQQLPRWRFARLCGLRPELLARPEVVQAFEQAWGVLIRRFEVPAA